MILSHHARRHARVLSDAPLSAVATLATLATSCVNDTGRPAYPSSIDGLARYSRTKKEMATASPWRMRTDERTNRMDDPAPRIAARRPPREIAPMIARLPNHSAQM